MSIEIRVPNDLGVETEIVLIKWHKTPGDSVAYDEPLFEIETEKCTMVIPAAADGRLSTIIKGEGEPVVGGEVVATFENSEISSTMAKTSPKDERVSQQPKNRKKTPQTEKAQKAQERMMIQSVTMLVFFVSVLAFFFVPDDIQPFFAILIFISSVVGMWVNSKEKKEKSASIREKILATPGFGRAELFVGCSDEMVAVADDFKNVCLCDKHEKIKVISSSELFAAEIVTDGASVTRTVRSSQVGSAIVGGVLLGGVGTIIGGLSGKKETKSVIKKIEVRMLVNDTSNPHFDIELPNMEVARKLHGLLDVIIKREEKIPLDAELKESRKEIPAGPPQQNLSLADELKKMAELRAEGVLTDLEFSAQKAKLLNK